MTIELIAILLVLCLSVIPLFTLTGRARYAGLLILLGGAGLVLAFGLQMSQVQATRAAYESNAAERPLEIPEDGFISSRTCRACHPREYATWHASYHRTMTQVATANSVLGDFSEVSLSLHGQDVRLFQRDGKYWAEIQEETEERTQVGEHEVVMTTGSHHMQFYWYSSGNDRELGKLSFVFLLSEQRWVPADSTFLRPPNFIGSTVHGQWNLNCINCHTTHGKPGIGLEGESLKRSGIRSIETAASEFGIACEACHGPAEDHVRLNKNPLRRYALHVNQQAEDSIIQPEMLDAAKAAQICGQCHSVHLPKTNEDVRRMMAEGFAFRAGHDLLSPDSERIVVRQGMEDPAIEKAVERDPSYFATLFWPDGMVRVTGREYNGLLDSPCYQHQDAARGIMTCMSCHEMHPPRDDPRSLTSWADDQLKAGMRGDAACLQCHTDFRDNEALAAHTHHLINASGSRCYNCHMPHTTYGLLKGIRSHTVNTPSVEESVAAKRPNACNLCHLDKTLQWTAGHLQRWYGISPPPLTGEQRKIAASILWTLKGDAGLRALMAWHMGWRPAMEASRADWMPPYLGLLMTDPYDAVRYIAYHSLLKHPRYGNFKFDFVSTEERDAALKRVTKVWAASQDRKNWATGEELLTRDDGTMLKNVISSLLQQRDERPVLLNE